MQQHYILMFIFFAWEVHQAVIKGGKEDKINTTVNLLTKDGLKQEELIKKLLKH